MNHIYTFEVSPIHGFSNFGLAVENGVTVGYRVLNPAITYRASGAHIQKALRRDEFTSPPFVSYGDNGKLYVFNKDFSIKPYKTPKNAPFLDNDTIRFITGDYEAQGKRLVKTLYLANAFVDLDRDAYRTYLSYNGRIFNIGCSEALDELCENKVINKNNRFVRGGSVPLKLIIENFGMYKKLVKFVLQV